MGNCNKINDKRRDSLPTTQVRESVGSKNKIIREDPPELFQDMPEWAGDKFKGEGIKRMRGYKCDIPINELNKIREDFWITKMRTGIIWKNLRQACTMDDIRAFNIIHSLGLSTKKGCINELIDGKGNCYRIPNFCINDPYFEKIIINEDTNYNYNRISNLIKLNMYDLYNNQKYIIECMDNTTGRDLKTIFLKRAGVANPHNVKIRLFFGGCEIEDDHMLYKHNVKNDYTVQVMVSPKNGE